MTARELHERMLRRIAASRRVFRVEDGMCEHGVTDAVDGWYHVPASVPDDAVDDGFEAVGPFLTQADALASMVSK